VTINYIERVQFYILSLTGPGAVMPKSYLSGAAKRSARET